MAGKLISVSDIQAELTRIWDSLEGTNKIRASLFNLIFYTPKKGRIEYIKTIAQKVIEKFPSRVIFITSDRESKQDYLHTEVSVISAGKAEFDVACDLIQIDVGGSQEKRVPFVLLPNIIPDLPIYIVWAEDPCQNNPLFYQLQELATRLIFDSDSTENLSDFSAALLKIYDPSSCAIADLNWGRMESWRELLSSTFYNDDRLAQLRATKNIQIFFNAQKNPFYIHTDIQSIYLQGWIACQLNWKLQGMQKNADGSRFFSYAKENGNKVDVNLYPESYEQIQSGSIISIDVTTEQEEHFSFGRDLAFPHLISMRFSTLEKCEIPLKYIFSKAESGQSLVKEISHKGTSGHFLKLLTMIQGINFRADRRI